MKRIKNYFRRPAEIHHYLIGVILMLGVAVSVMSLGDSGDRLFAVTPTFSFAQSGDTLIMTLDATGEGNGFLGAETHVTYDQLKAEVKSVDFGTCLFDNCIDISEKGVLRFFAVSALPENGGKSPASNGIFAKITLNFLTDQDVDFKCSKSQVITEAEVVEDRDCSAFIAKKSATGGGAGGAKCGNKQIETGEQCDDGNVVDGDGCSASCNTEVKNPACGNNTVENNEQCDDGNVKDGDGCSTLCIKEIGEEIDEEIGEGEGEGEKVGEKVGEEVEEKVEEADKSKKEESEKSGETLFACGNGVLEGDELCDDGNTASGDGCSAGCVKEAVPQKPKLQRIDVTECNVCSTNLQLGESTTLNTWAYYDDGRPATNITSRASYSASNDQVANLLKNAATGIGVGEATITAIFSDNGIEKTDTLKITINAPASEVGEGEGEGDGEDEVVVGGGSGRSGEVGDESEISGEGEEVVEEEVVELESELLTGGGSSIRPAAPETIEIAQRQAVAQAEAVIQEKPVAKKTSVVIEAPKKHEVLTRLDICRRQYPKVDFTSPADQDNDGLSNKTECYGGTHPLRYDTDGDACSDGAEIIHLGLNPNDPLDCGREAPTETLVIITDPQPGWILRDLEVSGMTPLFTRYVTVVAFPAAHNVIQGLRQGVEDLRREKDFLKVGPILDRLYRESLPAIYEFLSEYGSSYDYQNLTQAADRLKNEVNLLATNGLAFSNHLPELEFLSEQLALLDQNQVTLGTVGNFSDTELNGKQAKKFTLETPESLPSGKVYDLLAIATLQDGSSLSSSPVRFSLDDAVRVTRPLPRSIDDEPIPTEATAFENLWIGSVRADKPGEGVEIEIDDLRPTVTGDTEFGSQVFAVWNSVVLASSVISDSEEGAFSIEAPKDLETDIGHRVTLYAVKADETGRQARSESVNVFFRIKPAPPISRFAILAALLVLALGLSLAFIRRRMTRLADVSLTEAEAAARASKAQALYGVVPSSEILAPPSPLDAEFEQAFREAQEQKIHESMPVREVTPVEEAQYEKLEDQAAETEEETEKMPR